MADGSSVPAKISVGGAVQPIVPQSFEEAWRIAGALAASGLTPKDINTQEKVLAVVMAGAEIGMAPFQALQSFAVINGRPALWGDGMLGVARRYGVRVEETIDGDGEAAVATCTVTRPDTKEVITRRFSIADAKAAGLYGKSGPWTQYRSRMLQMRARSWALRDGCADMLRGLTMAEEAQDFTEVTHSEALPPPMNGAADGDTAAIIEHGDAFVGGELVKLVMKEYTAEFAKCEEMTDLNKVWASFERKYWKGKRKIISQNTYDGVSELFEQRKAILEKDAELLPWVKSVVSEFAEQHSLDAWWADEETKHTIATMSEQRQVEVTQLYEDRMEALA